MALDSVESAGKTETRDGAEKKCGEDDFVAPVDLRRRSSKKEDRHTDEGDAT